jgi:hypothetical protein
MVARWFLFIPKISNLCKFLSALDGKLLLYFMAIWNILRTFGIFYDHAVRFVFIWYIFSCFGIMYQRKIWQPWSAPGFFVSNNGSCFQVLLRAVRDEGFFAVLPTDQGTEIRNRQLTQKRSHQSVSNKGQFFKTSVGANSRLRAGVGANFCVGASQFLKKPVGAKLAPTHYTA